MVVWVNISTLLRLGELRSLIDVFVKVIIANIFILLSFVGPLSGNCRCVFGPHIPSFMYFHACSHQSFLCLFSHSNCLHTTLAETAKQ